MASGSAGAPPCDRESDVEQGAEHHAAGEAPVKPGSAWESWKQERQRRKAAGIADAIAKAELRRKRKAMDLKKMRGRDWSRRGGGDETPLPSADCPVRTRGRRAPNPPPRHGRDAALLPRVRAEVRQLASDRATAVKEPKQGTGTGAATSRAEQALKLKNGKKPASGSTKRKRPPQSGGPKAPQAKRTAKDLREGTSGQGAACAAQPPNRRTPAPPHPRSPPQPPQPPHPRTPALPRPPEGEPTTGEQTSEDAGSCNNTSTSCRAT